jgi:predicted dehydrogenase
MSFIRVGIIGFGKMGQIRARAAETIPDVKIVKVFDQVYDSPPAYPTATSAEEIIADPMIDAVFICMPNYFNKPLTIAALRAGKHTFCEKPPAFNAAEVAEIRAVEAECRKILMYGFNHRQHLAVIKLKALVDSGEYGNVLWMRGRYGKSVDGDYLRGWRAKKELAGGGILLDQGIHMLDLFLHIAGRPFDEVHAFVSSLYWKTDGIEDNVFATMRNRKTGLTASLHSTMTQWRHLFSFEVFLERGYMVLNGLKTGSGTYGNEELVVARNRSAAPAALWEDEERILYDVDPSWSFEAQHFFEAIRTNSLPRYGTSENAWAVMDLIDRIYEHDRHEAPNLFDQLQAHPAKSMEQ